MKQYIDKAAIVTEIERIKRITFTNFDEGVNCAAQTILEILDNLPIMEPPHIDLANIDVAKMVKEKEKFLQQILLPFGYSEDHVEMMVTSYRRGILDTLDKLESHETDKEE